MRLDDDFESEYREYDGKNSSFKSNSSFIYSLAGVSAVILMIFLVVFSMNNNKKSGSNSSINATVSRAEADAGIQYATQKSVDELISGSTLRAEDLDFWHDYDFTDTVSMLSAAVDITTDADGNPLSLSSNDPSQDGKHTLITYSDGSTEWLDINPYLILNTYNLANLVSINNIMKYYDNHVIASHAGVEISSIDDYVDFNKLKRNGIEFVMLRIGQRGYSTGEIMPDEAFADNLRRATDAGLDVGIYFFSEATSKEEAIEEAQFVLATLSANNATAGRGAVTSTQAPPVNNVTVSDPSVSAGSVSNNGVSDNLATVNNQTTEQVVITNNTDTNGNVVIRYPIVFYIEEVNSNDVRTTTVNQLLRTNLAISFMDTIRSAGYSPMVYGNKEYLLKKLSFGSLIGYDVWLGETGDLPDFPYEYNMWKYTNIGKLDGISGPARQIISFTDYSSR